MGCPQSSEEWPRYQPPQSFRYAYYDVNRGAGSFSLSERLLRIFANFLNVDTDYLERVPLTHETVLAEIEDHFLEHAPKVKSLRDKTYLWDQHKRRKQFLLDNPGVLIALFAHTYNVKVIDAATNEVIVRNNDRNAVELKLLGWKND